MEQHKLLSIICFLFLAVIAQGQFTHKGFAINLSVGSKINQSELRKDNPGTYGLGMSLIYEKPTLSTTANTSYHVGKCESFYQFSWGIGPMISRKHLKVRPQIGMGMLFYTAKENKGYQCADSIGGSFSTFSVSTNLSVDYYFTKMLGVTIDLAKNYNIDLPLTQVMGGLLIKLGKKPPPPIRFAMN